MIPEDIFYGLIDAGMTFDVINAVDPKVGDILYRPPHIFSVSKAENGKIRVSTEREQTIDYADKILGLLNVLLYQGHGWEGPQLSNDDFNMSDGRWTEFEVVSKEGNGGKPTKRTKIRCEWLVGDREGAPKDTSIVEVRVGDDDIRLYTLHLVDETYLHELYRHSILSIPPSVHALIAAVGYYEESFIAQHGKRQLELAERRSRRALEAWDDLNYR